MKLIKTSLAAVALIVTTVTSVSAITFDFRSGGTNSSNTYGNTRTFTSDGLTVTVTALAYDGSNWHEGYLGQYSSYGLYNRNSDNDGSHTFDNQGWTDYALFQFSEIVDLEKMYFKVWGDGDFDYWTENLNLAPSAGGTNISHNSSGWVNIFGTTNSLLVGAEYFSNPAQTCDDDDRFKIKKLVVERADVPDSGSSIVLLGLSLLALYSTAKRR